MDNKKFNLFNRICSLVALAVSAVTYLLTIEPTASFWDCGEFIASSYKLEVGHPPGNPMFQLIARFFTMFGDNMHAAVLVNAMSAICSALTIYFLYLTLVFFTKRVTKNPVAICASALVGALAYCFSDTFWFSAVEGEVYAMSSFFTAVVFWAMTKWYEQADQKYANRWIVLISFLMGLCIGVHLLNLLAIPALVFMYYYKQREDKQYNFKELVKIFLIGVLILGIVYFGIVPYLPKIAAYFDLFFVNVLGLGYNTGSAFFMIALLALCFMGIFRTMKKEKVFWNTVLLCFTSIIIGFSVFTVVIIRSSAKTPTNEYQPDNAFTLVRYLNREQYGRQPLLYGQYFDAPYEITTDTYWAPLNGKYKKVPTPLDAKYLPEGKMLFPRMWSGSSDGSSERFYSSYMHGKGTPIKGQEYKKPTFGSNLAYFFDYQLNWMYWRYFMWNFVGRQNDIHSPTPGDIFHGNWESGVGFLDNLRLGDQSEAPAILAENKGKNHYFFLPLILGLLGLFFQFDRDKRGCWLNFLMFFMTGIAIVIYLNQPPFQVRERDYAYAGSFYFFSVWIGLGVAALVTKIESLTKKENSVLVGALTGIVCLFVPALMAAQNWDDHDRSDRYTAVEMARNYLNSVPENGILITHGDNDTFPLWYAQEVEEFRTDVRIVNTSLLGTDWHIDQMKYAVNQSAPLPLTVGQDQYLYGRNDLIPVKDRGEVMDIKDVMTIFKHPKIVIQFQGKDCDYIPAKKIRIPVNKENVIKSGILDEKYSDIIPDSIIFEIPKGKNYLTKPELFLLDLLSNYEWDRPICMLNLGGELNIGEKDYLEYRGMSYMLVPVKNQTNSMNFEFVDSDKLYHLIKENYSFDKFEKDFYVDYQNLYTFIGVSSIRGMFMNAAEILISDGEYSRALEMLDMGVLAGSHLPLDAIPVGLGSGDYAVLQMIQDYYTLGQTEKARSLAVDIAEELVTSCNFYADFYDFGKEEYKQSAKSLYFLSEIVNKYDDKEIAQAFSEMVEPILNAQ